MMTRFGLFVSSGLLALALLPLFMASPLQAGEGGGAENATGVGDLGMLPEYLSEAAENNAELRAAYNRWQAALDKVPQATSLPDPRLSFGAYIQPVETRTGPQRARVGLSQTFPWFGKLGLKGERQTRKAAAAKAVLDAKKLDVFFAVKRAYYEYAYVARAVEITTEIIELVRYLEGIARARYSVGSSPYAAVIRTQVELGKLEDRLAGTRDMMEPLKAQLNAALNRPVDTEVPEPPSVPVMRLCMTDEELLRGMLETNPRLLSLEYAAAGEAAGIELAEKDYYPDITASLQTIFTGEARTPGVTNADENPVIAGLSFNLPIWQEPRRAAVREAKSNLKAVKRDKQGLARRLESALELALYKYRDAERKIDLYSNTLIPKAVQSLNVSLEAFQTGEGTSLDLLDAEKTLLELKLARVRALTDQALRLSEMETIVGQEIPCEIHGSVINSGVEKKVPLNKQQR
jgi:outer membrane protein TolC